MSDIFPGVGTGPNAQLGLGNRARTSPLSILWDRDDPAHGRPRVRSPSLGPRAAPARLSKGGHVRFSGSAGTGLRTLTPRTPAQVVLALSREAPASLSWGLRGHISHLLGHADPAEIIPIPTCAQCFTLRTSFLLDRHKDDLSIPVRGQVGAQSGPEGPTPWDPGGGSSEGRGQQGGSPGVGAGMLGCFQVPASATDADGDADAHTACPSSVSMRASHSASALRTSVYARLLPQLPGEVFPAPALPSGVWVSTPCRAGSRLPGGRAGQAGRQGGAAVGVRPGPCAPPVGSHPAAAVSWSLPGERWRLLRRLRFGRRARGRAPEGQRQRSRETREEPAVAGDSGCRSAAWAGGGGRCRCPARWTSAPRGPFCPRAPPGQLSGSRKGHGAGVRGVTPSRRFPLARWCGPHGRTQTCPVFPASPMDPDSPDSQRVSSPRRGPALVSTTGGTEGTMGRPSSSPKGARKRFLAILGKGHPLPSWR
nr:uncharacterized protein LOC112581885 [Bubalus bubalis]